MTLRPMARLDLGYLDVAANELRAAQSPGGFAPQPKIARPTIGVLFIDWTLKDSYLVCPHIIPQL
jgi:hypothetical protein